MTEDLRNLDKHFKFGDNWLRFVESIDAKVIKSAEKGFNKLFFADAIKGKSFLDIGCGSGLHSLAALNQGAKSVLAVDIDPAAFLRWILIRRASMQLVKCYRGTTMAIIGNVKMSAFLT
ncbi:MAG: 50S ribosomal protein L11 methyltransferase [Planctomycetota bacterium]|jgi:16S rRNA G966 N2-methylase RsmD